jgi:hypothetical protein
MDHLPTPPDLSEDGQAYFHDLVRAASQHFGVVAADLALFEAAARSFDHVRALAKMAAAAKKAGNDQEWLKLIKLEQATERNMRANLRTLRLTPDWRSNKAANRTRAEEGVPEDSDWAGLLS